MATETESLVVKLDADISKFASQMQTAGNVTATQSKKINDSLARIQQQAPKTEGAFRLQKNAAQQLGFQLQDMAVQAQMGVSAFTILGQQGSQLASVLGPGGAILGAIIAVGAALSGVLFAGLSSANKETKTLADSLSLLKSSMDDLTKTQLGTVMSATSFQIQLLTKSAAAAWHEANKVALQLERLSKKPKTNENILEVRKLKEELLTFQAAASATEAEIIKLNQTMDAAKERFGGVSKETEDANKKITSIIETLFTQSEVAGKTREELTEYMLTTLGASDATKEYAAGLWSNIAALDAQAKKIKENQELFALMVESQAATEQDFNLSQQEAKDNQAKLDIMLEQEAAFTMALQEIEFTGLETKEEAFIKEVELHKAMLDSKLLNEESFNAAQQQTVAKYEKLKKQEEGIDKKSSIEKLNTQQNAIRAGMALNTALFGDSKAVAAGLIIADTAVGIQKSLAINPYDYVNVGIIAATGAANLANALSASKGGGSISSGSGGGTPPQQQQQQNFEPETVSLDVSAQGTSGTSTGTITLRAEDSDEIGTDFSLKVKRYLD